MALWGLVGVLVMGAVPCGVDNLYVKVSAIDRWGEPLPAIHRSEGKTTVLPGLVLIDRCVTSLKVEVVGTGEELDATVVERGPLQFEAIAHQRGYSNLWVVAAFGEFAWVWPGWRDLERVWGGGGVRFQAWRRFVHLDLAVKATSFSSYLLETPVALDATIGFPLELVVGDWDLRASLGVGLWSLVCPTIRPTVLARRDRFTIQATFGWHLYPAAFAAAIERPAMQYDVPVENYVFWSGSVSVGLSL